MYRGYNCYKGTASKDDVVGIAYELATKEYLLEDLVNWLSFWSRFLILGCYAI